MELTMDGLWTHNNWILLMAMFTLYPIYERIRMKMLYDAYIQVGRDAKEVKLTEKLAKLLFGNRYWQVPRYMFVRIIASSIVCIAGLIAYVCYWLLYEQEIGLRIITYCRDIILVLIVLEVIFDGQYHIRKEVAARKKETSK